MIQSHKEPPLWYSHLLSAKAVQVPVLAAASLTYQELQSGAMQEVLHVAGVMPGCTYPLDTLTLPYFMQLLGEFYDGSVQMVGDSCWESRDRGNPL